MKGQSSVISVTYWLPLPLQTFSHPLNPSSHPEESGPVLTHGEEQLADVVAVQRGALSGQPGGEVGDAHVHHVFVGVYLPGLGGLDVTAGLRGQIDHHRAGLHRLNVLLYRGSGGEVTVRSRLHQLNVLLWWRVGSGVRSQSGHGFIDSMCSSDWTGGMSVRSRLHRLNVLQ